MTADDRAFDLLRAVADHADEAGLPRTARLAEAAMDAFLEETGRLAPRSPRTERGTVAPRFIRGLARQAARG